MRKKISELESKTQLAQTDIIPIVDSELQRRKTKKTTIADLAAAIDAVTNSQRGVPGGVATLDEVTGKLPLSQIPESAFTDVFSVVSEAAMLALPAQTGDIAVRTDINRTFVLAGPTPTVIHYWQEIVASAAPANLNDVLDVDAGIPDVKAALVFDPDTQLWRSADIAKLTDGGIF
jgi:hypothetical protein